MILYEQVEIDKAVGYICDNCTKNVEVYEAITIKMDDDYHACSPRCAMTIIDEEPDKDFIYAIEFGENQCYELFKYLGRYK